MEVVEKIESLQNENGYISKVNISNNYCEIILNNFIIESEEKTKIEAVYNAVVEFIKWYNNQNKFS